MPQNCRACNDDLTTSSALLCYRARALNVASTLAAIIEGCVRGQIRSPSWAHTRRVVVGFPVDSLSTARRSWQSTRSTLSLG
eukprot:365680-Chlamydomonas_euryale.AAC.4